MIKLNKITDSAVVILGVLSSRRPNKFSTSKLSIDTGLAVPTVAKVCKLLTNANLIKAGRGVNGGYFCETSPDNINVALIVEAIDGPIAITACVEDSDELCDSQSMCLLSGNWNKANSAIQNALKSVTLSELLNPEEFFMTNKNNNVSSGRETINLD